MLESFLFIVFVLLLIHYILFLSVIYKGLTKIGSDNINRFVSVIIPFRNESENILRSLKSIEAQSYPKEKFEVVYVNDSSTDDSMEILEKNRSKESIRIIFLPEDYSITAHKKRAVRYGIENSTGEIIVTTDADCIHNENWLESLLKNLDDETGFVSGPVEFINDEKLF